MKEMKLRTKTLEEVVEQLLGIATELEGIITLDAPEHLTTLETKELEAALKHTKQSLALIFIVPQGKK
jgi:hypothetical protein